MFTLSKKHQQSFEEGYRRNFEDRMAAYIESRFPFEFQELGESKVRKIINDGVDRAAGYEIRSQPDVARFITFMISIGPDFDTSRKTPWFKPILEEKEIQASERLDEVLAVATRMKNLGAL